MAGKEGNDDDDEGDDDDGDDDNNDDDDEGDDVNEDDDEEDDDDADDVDVNRRSWEHDLIGFILWGRVDPWVGTWEGGRGPFCCVLSR